eukprot:6045571-Karenia_brevis.AAC.2
MNQIGRAPRVPDLGKLGVILRIPSSPSKLINRNSIVEVPDLTTGRNAGGTNFAFLLNLSESNWRRPPGIRFGRAGRDSGDAGTRFRRAGRHPEESTFPLQIKLSKLAEILQAPDLGELGVILGLPISGIKINYQNPIGGDLRVSDLKELGVIWGY